LVAVILQLESEMESIKKFKNVICELVDNSADELNAISHEIWSHPELAWNEHHAHKLLTEFLEHKGFAVEKHYLGLETAFIATIGQGTPHVAILCEYDALPEIGHACGHNLIAEVGIGAGLAIKAAMEAAGTPLGKLTVMGTPAEEGGAGKVIMLNKGAFKDIDFCMMAHPWPDHVTTAPNSWLARDYVDVTFRGKSVHASMVPWEGVNALDAAVLAYNNVSCLRQQTKPSCRIYGIIKQGGVTTTVIPDMTMLRYSTTTPTIKELMLLREKLSNCLQAAALATGCQVEMEWCDMPYKNLMSNKMLENLYRSNCRELEVQLLEDESKLNIMFGTTDMGNVSHEIPSIQPVFYTGHFAMNHSRPFTDASGSKEAQKYVLEQAKALAMTAIDILCQPELLPKMKEQFAQELEEAKNA